MLIDRPTLARRVRAGLLLAAFLVAPAGNLFGHGCTHHDRLTTEHAATAGAAGGAAAAHAAEKAASPESHHPPSHGSESHHAPCTCVGACHGTSTPADSAVPDRTLAVAPSDDATSGFPARDSVQPDRTALRLLPFPNGPPRTY